VEFLKKPRTWVVAGTAAAGLALLCGAWVWFAWRVEVPPGHYMVVVSLWGKDLPDGEILAPDENYKGIRQEVRPEGRYWLNPLAYRHEIYPVIRVDSGKCLVLTRLHGKQISAERLARGEILAEDGERGVLREVLKEGSYRFNPYAYHWDIVDTVKVGADEVGVRTLKVGKNSADLVPPRWYEPYYRVRTLSYLVPAEYRGVQATPVSPGVYYLNPHVESIVPVNVSSRIVTFRDIEFPSLDGFTLRPEVTVKYRVLPEKAPELLVTLTDEGHLFQGDATQGEQDKNQVLQKVVLPVIRGTVRLKGSSFHASAFVAGRDRWWFGQPNPYQALREALVASVPKHCELYGVQIEEINLGKFVDTPELADLAEQVQKREQARLRREQNAEEIERLKAEQVTAANRALADRNRAVVEAETRLKTAEIEAEQRLAAEEKRLKQELDNAAKKLEAAKDQARATVTVAESQAEVIRKNNDAEVAGLRTAIQGFPSPEAYAQYQMTAKLAPALAEVFASDTSDFARLFTQYLTPPRKPLPMGTADRR